MTIKHVHVTLDGDWFERKDPEKTWEEILKRGIQACEPWVGQRRYAGIKPKYVGHPDAGIEEPQYQYWNGKEWVDKISD